MSTDLSRRDWITGVVGGVVATTTAPTRSQASATRRAPYLFLLSEHQHGSPPQRQWGKSAADRGADRHHRRRPATSAIEPWSGGTRRLREGRRLAQGPGETDRPTPACRCRTSIGFAEWIVDDEGQAQEGTGTGRGTTWTWPSEIGGKRLAAPPVGATGGGSRRDDPKNSRNRYLDLFAVADRYRALLELGRSLGVTPIVEVWGDSKTLHRLGEILLVAGRVRQPRRSNPPRRVPPL